MTLDAAYAACARLARTHYENFPVASHLLPRRMRPHVAAVYAFARLADDIADEGDAPLDVRNARLDEWLARLDAAVHGGGPPSSTVLEANMAEIAPAVFTALGATVRDCALPPALFEDLVSAFRQDTTVARYATWPDLLDYCRRSANPVGRLVLRIGGWRDPELDEASDAVCSALQLTNFWQDLAVDWTRGRLYVPAQEYQRTGAVTASLDQRPAHAGVARCDVCLRRPARATCSLAGARCATGSPDGCAGNCASPGSAACASSSAWIGMAMTSSRSAPRWAPRTCRRYCGAPWSGGHEPRHQLLLRVCRAAETAARGDRRGLGLLPRR